MKKYLYCAFIALITLACSQNDEPSSDISTLVIPDTFYGQTPVYNTSRALTEVQPESWDGSGTVDSRTYAIVDPDNSKEYFQYWTENDPISLFFTTQNLKYQLISHKDGDLDVGLFKLVGPKEVGKSILTNYYYSVYPYKENTEMDRMGYITYTFPDTQHYNTQLNGDSYSNLENAMVAIEPKVGTDSLLYFQNFCSYLQLQLVDSLAQYTNKKVDRIILLANNEKDKLAGTCTVALEDNSGQGEDHAPFKPRVYMKETATNKITLECGGVPLSQDKDNPSKFWFVLPGEFTFTDGFVVTVVFNDQTFYRKATKKKIKIQRSHIKPMVPFDPKPENPSGPIFYRYQDPANDPLTFPVENTFYGEDGLRLEVIGQKWDPETREWNILLSGTLKAIGGNSFNKSKSNKDLDYVRVRNGEESISLDPFAFYDCLADSVIVHNDIDDINYQAFDASTITHLYLHEDVTNFKTNAGSGSMIKEIHVDGNVQTIDYNAFNNCDDLELVNIPNGDATNHANTIGNLAFNDCDNLRTVNYPMVSHVDDGAFDGCNQLLTVNIPEAETIGSQAFNGCNSLTTVTITKVERIELEAFNECSSLSTIDLSSVKYIENKAFYNCTSLGSVDIASVIEIGWNAFTGTNLQTVSIPATCTKIGEGAFNKCTNLKTAYCYAEMPPFIETDNSDDSYVFGDVHADFCIYVPYECKEDLYLGNNVFGPDKTNWWKKYASIMYEMEQQ